MGYGALPRSRWGITLRPSLGNGHFFAVQRVADLHQILIGRPALAVAADNLRYLRVIFRIRFRARLTRGPHTLLPDFRSPGTLPDGNSGLCGRRFRWQYICSRRLVYG